MRRIAPQQHNFVKYIIRFNNQNHEIIEPDSWRTSNKEIVRSKQYHGMIITLSDNISFHGDTALVLKDIYDRMGVIAKVKITEYVRSPETNEWEYSFSGDLDFSTFSFIEGEFSCRINSDDMTKKLSSRWQVEVNADNLETLDGKTHGLGKVRRIDVKIHDRVLKGESLLDIGTEYTITSKTNQTEHRAILFTEKNDGFAGALPVSYSISRETVNASPGSGNVDSIFFYNQQKMDVGVNIDIFLKYKYETNSGETGSEVGLFIYEYDVDDSGQDIAFNYSGFQTIEAYKTLSPGTVNEVEVKKSILFNAKPKTAYTFLIATKIPSGKVLTITNASLNLWGRMTATATTNKTFMPFDIFERFIIMMGGTKLSSNFLKSSRLSIATGYMIRNVPDKPFNYTFQKLYNSFSTVYPIGLSVNGSHVKIEKREYFYQDFISYDFGNDVMNIEYKFDKETAYSELKIGFETSNFSKEDALDEYNVMTTWVTPINMYKKALNMVSSIQASSYVIEKLRRIQYLKDTERTYTRRGDSTVFFLDLRDNDNTLRKWADDFESPPTNTFSEDTAYNLRISPMNRLRNLGKWVNHGLIKFADKYITFSSSTGGTSMRSKPIGKKEMGESDNVRIGFLGNPVYISEKAIFKIKPMNLFKILNEKKHGVEKFYGLFEFNDNGVKRRGYLLSYKPDNFEVTLQLIDNGIIN